MGTASPSGPLRSSGLPRSVVILLGLSAAVVVAAGMKAASDIVGPVMLALIFTIAVHTLRRILDRSLPSWLSTTLCLVVSFPRTERPSESAAFS